MKQVFYALVAVLAFSTAFGAVFQTTRNSYKEKFQWIVENFDKLPEEVLSRSFPLTRNEFFRFAIMLKTNTEKNVLKIFLKCEYLSDDFFTVNGTVVFKSSGNHVFGERLLKKKSLNQFHHMHSEQLLLTVDFRNLFGTRRLPEVFDMLNNTLVLDFSVMTSVSRSMITTEQVSSETVDAFASSASNENTCNGSCNGFVMRTSVVSYQEEFQWIVEDLQELPEEIKSLSFPLTENEIFKGALILMTNAENDVLELRLMPKRQRFRSEVIVNGTVIFKNSRNHVFGERLLEKKSFTSFYLKSKLLLLTVDSSDLFGTNRLSEVFEMLNNKLVLDFSVSVDMIVPEYVNSTETD